MNFRSVTVPALWLALLAATPGLLAVPPYWGTIFVNPDIITAADPTSFVAVTPNGQGGRWMYDRRANGGAGNWTFLTAHLFNATYAEGGTIEIQVNPEFAAADALVEAQKYAPIIGRLPAALRKDVQTVWIHRGVNAYGGGNNNLLIHTGQTALYEADGILEETLVHEASHTSLDAAHAASAGWLAAQAADGEFISAYARDNPTREDVAETYLLYFALRYRRERLTTEQATTIAQTIPNRIAYLDAQRMDLRPLWVPPVLAVTDLAVDPGTQAWTFTWDSRPGATYAVEVSPDLTTWTTTGATVPSQGITTTVTRPAAAPAPRSFYRVRQVTTP